MKSVEQALKTPASELISAASRPATTMPRMPTGSTSLDHQREGRLGHVADGRAVRRPTIDGQSRARGRYCASASAIMPGMMKMKTGSSFRNAAKMRAAPGLALARRAQGPLHDVLVGAPVPQADDRRAEQHAEPRVVAVEVPGHPARFLHGRPGAFDAGRDERLPEVEHVGAEHGAQLAPAAERLRGRRTVSSTEPRRGSPSAPPRCRPRRACRRARCRARSAGSPRPSRSRSC